MYRDKNTMEAHMQGIDLNQTKLDQMRKTPEI